MLRKLKSGEYHLYSRKKDPKTGKRRNLGTFPNVEAAKKTLAGNTGIRTSWMKSKKAEKQERGFA